MDATIDSTVPEDIERAMIVRSRDTLARATGAPPKGWLSIARQQHSAESYAEQIQDAYAWLAGEGAPRVLPLHVTPYVTGLPFRMNAFEELLLWLAERPGSVFLSAGELAAALARA
jgi:hypothetical protein